VGIVDEEVSSQGINGLGSKAPFLLLKPKAQEIPWMLPRQQQTAALNFFAENPLSPSAILRKNTPIKLKQHSFFFPPYPLLSFKVLTMWL